MGVSGFKVAAADRDELQEIKREAEKQEFDILLVFMFDRLGRKDNETPFVLKWFVEQGISAVSYTHLDVYKIQIYIASLSDAAVVT